VLVRDQRPTLVGDVPLSGPREVVPRVFTHDGATLAHLWSAFSTTPSRVGA
jgi:hypothetical protein